MDINSLASPYIDNTNKKLENLSGKDTSSVDKKKLKEVSEAFEAEFLKIFLKQSKKIIEKQNDDKNKAPGKDIMTDFMLERLAEDMAKSSPLGISDMIMQNVENMQKSEKQSGTKQETQEV